MSQSIEEQEPGALETSSDVKDSGTGTKRKFSPPKWTKALIVFFAIVGIVWLATTSFQHKAVTKTVNTQAALPNDKHELSVVGIEASEEYNHKVEAYAQSKAEEAIQSGRSYVRPVTPSAKPELLPKEEKKTVAPAPPPIPTRELPPSTVQRQQARNKGDQSMAAFLAQVDARLHQQDKSAIQVLNKPAPRIIRTAVAVREARDDMLPPGLKPGDILYSMNRITLDSDAPGPAMVEVVDGPYTGAKAIGSFKRMNEHLTLEFSSLTMPDGTKYAIKGYAVDPYTDRTAINSTVSTHAFERWFKFAAAKFLEGFGEAVSMSGSSAYSSPYGSGYSVPNFSLNDQLWIAGGKVGQGAARVLERDFNIPPTVTLKSGTDIGILIVDIGTPKNPNQTQQAIQAIQEQQGASQKMENQYYERSVGNTPDQRYYSPANPYINIRQ